MQNQVMRILFISFIMVFSAKVSSQKIDTVNLSKIKFSELMPDFTKENDAKLRLVKPEEMELCFAGSILDDSSNNRIGYLNILYPGIIFQKSILDSSKLSKIHLTKAFKGYLPNGNYVDLSILKVSDILKQNDSLKLLHTQNCSSYVVISDNESIYYYIKLDDAKMLESTFNDHYYSNKKIEGIDIVLNAKWYSKYQISKEKPLIFLDGKEVSRDFLKYLNPNDIKSINVLKEKSATDKYGDKGKNGVVEIYLLKNKKKNYEKLIQ